MKLKFDCGIRNSFNTACYQHCDLFSPVVSGFAFHNIYSLVMTPLLAFRKQFISKIKFSHKSSLLLSVSQKNYGLKLLKV